MSQWCSANSRHQPWWCVTAGRTLAVAISGGGLHYSGVGDMVGLEHFLSIRETWVGQPWPEAGRAPVMEAGAAGGCCILWCSCLWQLNPWTGAWLVQGTHPPSPSSTTQRIWNFLQGTSYKNIDLKIRKHTYPWSVSHYGPTGCWKLFIAMGEGISTLTTILVLITILQSEGNSP